MLARAKQAAVSTSTGVSELLSMEQTREILPVRLCWTKVDALLVQVMGAWRPLGNARLHCLERPSCTTISSSVTMDGFSLQQGFCGR